MEEAAAAGTVPSSSSSLPPLQDVEIWENQKYVVGFIDFSLNGGEWIQHPRLPYSFKSDNSPAPEPDLYSLPSSNYRWTTNWRVRIDRNGTTTDSRGWEYATRLRTFETTSSSDRQPRTVKTLTDNARRRCLYRQYRQYDQNRLDEEIINEVKVSLVIVQGIRKRIQILSNQLKGRLKEDKEVVELVKSVKSSVMNVQEKIKLVEESSTSNEKLSLSIRKFKNDIKKEQLQLESFGIQTVDDNLDTLTPSTPLSSSSSSFSSPLSSMTPSNGIKPATAPRNNQSLGRRIEFYNESEKTTDENDDDEDNGGRGQSVGTQLTLVQHRYGRSDDDHIVGEEYDPIEERSKSIDKIRADLTKVIYNCFLCVFFYVI